MKIFIINGGSYNGNTSHLVNAFVEGCVASGHGTTVWTLRDDETRIKVCRDCELCREKGCYKTGKCRIQNDAFFERLPKIQEADCLIIASPLRFGALVPAVLTVRDRFAQPYYTGLDKGSVPPVPAGRIGGYILTGGGSSGPGFDRAVYEIKTGFMRPFCVDRGLSLPSVMSLATDTVPAKDDALATEEARNLISVLEAVQGLPRHFS